MKCTIQTLKNWFVKIKKTSLTEVNINSYRILMIGMGIIYVIAFLSLFVQLKGLVFETGIVPIKQIASIMLNKYDVSLLSFPTIFILNSSDMFITLICCLGVVSALLLIAGIIQFLSALLAWFFYLSFVTF